MTAGLNLGSGPHYAEGWTNVDLHDPGGGHRPPDVDASAFALDAHFGPGEFDRAYLGHFLEHIEWRFLPELFSQLRHVLAPGATVMAVGPCIHRAIATRQPRHIIEAILADPRTDTSDGRGHAWTATTELTVAALEAGGLTDVTALEITEVDRPEWPNPSVAAWQCAVRGTAP